MDLGLFEQIDSNRRRSVWLILCAVALLAAVGGILGAATVGTPWGGIAVAAAVGALLALVAWNQGSGIVLAASGATEVRKEEDPQLVNVVEELAIGAGLPRPRLFLIRDGAMNAFATGMSPDRGVVAITSGLRDRLSRDELQGVMAHELAHIGNYDSRVMVLLAVIVGTIAILSDIFLRSLRVSGRSGKGKGGAAILLIALAAAILAPVASMMIQFAVSRRREYLADATAAAITRNPGALADALEKLSTCRDPLDRRNRGTQHLYIVNPFHVAQSASSPFASHPPIAERIRRLRALAGRRT